MGRNLLVVKVVIGNVKIALLNTHLESMLTSSDERINQLNNCFIRAQNFPPEFNVFFGGDMNLRDWETKDIVPENMPDLWVQSGSWLSTKYTWDLTENTNKEMPTDRQPQCRFDRFYLRDSNPKTLQLRYFGLGGQDIVKDTDMFPSDHWAIIIRFSKIQSETTAVKTERESDTCSNWRA
ncbi:unnamed protein product [Orchesella dallaii]|uniref:Tyrosyl-DNA phosphodiesterase 2 n=1 Tax=Orchesella dallaii TaxID=48710 RepID=A0ABP1S0G6_9HEXA